MAAPTKPYITSGKITGTKVDTITVKAYNRTTGESATTTTNSKGEYSFDLNDTTVFATNCTTDDVVEYSVNGYGYGATTHTVNTRSGSAKLSTISLTDVAATSGGSGNCGGVSI